MTGDVKSFTGHRENFAVNVQQGLPVAYAKPGDCIPTVSLATLAGQPASSRLCDVFKGTWHKLLGTVPVSPRRMHALG